MADFSTSHSSEARLRLVLVANYRPDAQESMLRFADLLQREFLAAGLKVDCLRPEPKFQTWFPNSPQWNKWAGYVDKLIVFPRQLRQRIRTLQTSGKHIVCHVLDHSNAPYLPELQAVPHLITCHDLLAVRAARGEFPGVQVRGSGRVLQRSILKYLRTARFVACDSAATQQDVLRLTEISSAQTQVIHVALNHPYRRLGAEMARERLAHAQPALAQLLGSPFLLHVGGNAWYKNRAGVVQLLARLQSLRPGKWRLVLAGHPASPEVQQAIRAAGCADVVVEWPSPSNDVLEALYSLADALVFPSHAEGFGWPVIEAQACGCPVLTSDREPLPEVAGEAALFCDPEKPAAAAEALLQLLENPGNKLRLTQAGEQNVARFSTPKMVGEYLAVYRRLAAGAD